MYRKQLKRLKHAAIKEIVMKLKNVKIGTRVKLKKDYWILNKGMVGTIIEDGNINPYISWDNFKEGHNGCEETEKTLGRLGLPDKSVWAAPIVYLKRIKEQ